MAKGPGIHLSSEEAVLYRKDLIEQLGQFDAFVQARMEEPGPPMVSAAGNLVGGRVQRKTPSIRTIMST